MPENGTGNPYWLRHVKPPERGTEHDFIFKSNPSLIELQIGCISREIIIKNLKENVLYKNLNLKEFRECVDGASKTLDQLKIALGLNYVRLTGAPADKFQPLQITVFYATNLTNVLDGYIWEANNILGQYEEYTKRNQIILGIIERLIARWAN